VTKYLVVSTRLDKGDAEAECHAIHSTSSVKALKDKNIALIM